MGNGIHGEIYVALFSETVISEKKKYIYSVRRKSLKLLGHKSEQIRRTVKFITIYFVSSIPEKYSSSGVKSGYFVRDDNSFWQ